MWDFKYLTYVQVMAHLKQGSHISFMSESTNLFPEVCSPHHVDQSSPNLIGTVLDIHCGGNTQISGHKGC